MYDFLYVICNMWNGGVFVMMQVIHVSEPFVSYKIPLKVESETMWGS